MSWLEAAGLSVLAFVVSAGGFVLTLGGSIGPWAGWFAALLISGLLAWWTVPAVMDERTLRRDRQAAADRAASKAPYHTPEP